MKLSIADTVYGFVLSLKQGVPLPCHANGETERGRKDLTKSGKVQYFNTAIFAEALFGIKTGNSWNTNANGTSVRDKATGLKTDTGNGGPVQVRSTLPADNW